MNSEPNTEPVSEQMKAMLSIPTIGEPNTELKVYHTICEDGYRRELVAKDDVETLIAQKVAEAEQNILKAIEDTTAMSQDGTIWIDYNELKSRLELKADKGK